MAPALDIHSAAPNADYALLVTLDPTTPRTLPIDTIGKVTSRHGGDEYPLAMAVAMSFSTSR